KKEKAAWDFRVSIFLANYYANISTGRNNTIGFQHYGLKASVWALWSVQTSLRDSVCSIRSPSGHLIIFFLPGLYLFFICCDRVFLNVTGIMFQFFITPQEVLP